MEMKHIYHQYLTLLIGCAMLHFGDSSRVSNDSINLHLVASSGDETSSAGPCPSGWVMSPSKRKCFQYIKNYTSWDESERHCQGNQGHLAAIGSLRELKFVEKLCGEVVNGCWIGGRRNKSTIVVDWRWSDKTTRNVSIIHPTHLRSNCNNLSCRSDEKISLCALTSGTDGSNLVTEKCNSSHAYICMTHIENKCHHMCCHREYLISLAVVSGVILCISLNIVVWLVVYRHSKRRKNHANHLIQQHQHWSRIHGKFLRMRN